MEERVIVRYYRKGYRIPRGCVVGIVKDGGYNIGYSLYHKNLEVEAGVPFNKKRAVQIAKGRIIKPSSKPWPQSLMKITTEIRKQCWKILDGGNNSGEDVTDTGKD